jgi:hypothetical protein
MLWHIGQFFTCVLKLHLDCGIVGFENNFPAIRLFVLVCVYTRL